MKKNIVVASCFCLFDIFSCGLTQNSSLFGMINTEDVSKKEETSPIVPMPSPPGLLPWSKSSSSFGAPSSSSSSAHSSSYERLISIMKNFKATPSLEAKRQYIYDNARSIESAIDETYSNDAHGNSVSISEGCLEELSLEDLWNFYTVAINVHSSTQPPLSAPMSERYFCKNKQLLQNVIFKKALCDLKTQSVPTGLIREKNVFELFSRIMGDFCRELKPYIAYIGDQQYGIDHYHGKDINSKCRFHMISYLAQLVKCLYDNSFYISKNNSVDYDISESMKAHLKDQLNLINLHEIFYPMIGFFQFSAFINSTASSKARLHYFAFALCMYKKLNNLRDLLSDKYDDFLMFHLCQCIGSLNESVAIAGSEKNRTMRPEDRSRARENVEQDRRACMNTIRQLISMCIQRDLCSPDLISSFDNILWGINDKEDIALTQQMFASFPGAAPRKNSLLGNEYTFYKRLDHFSWFPEIPNPRLVFFTNTWFGSSSSSSSSSNAGQQLTQVTRFTPSTMQFPYPTVTYLRTPLTAPAVQCASHSNGGQQSTQGTQFMPFTMQFPYPTVTYLRTPLTAPAVQCASHSNAGQQLTLTTPLLPAHPGQ